MILFINEEKAYRHWITHHRDGFVVDGRHRPKWRQLMLHRAICPQVKQASSKRTHWTTGPRFKACSQHSQELIDWVSLELGQPCEFCPTCGPNERAPPEALQQRTLRPLAAEIVDYVLEVAMMHLEEDSPPYQLTVGTIVEYMGKSVTQLAPILDQLLQDGYLASNSSPRGKGAARMQQRIYPTSTALRTLPYYSESTEEMVQADLEKLQ